MQLNKSVATINAILKILDIMSLRSIFFKNKFGFIIGALNPNMSFFFTTCKCTKMDRSGPKWIEVVQMDRSGHKWTKWNKDGPNGQIKTKVDIIDRI